MAVWKRQVLTYEFVEPGERMNGDRFLNFLTTFVWPVVRDKRIVRPILLMDNARYHFTQPVKDFLRARKWEVLKQSPYSPDQNPLDSHFFAQVKNPLRGRRFATTDLLKVEFERIAGQISEAWSFSGIDDLPAT